MVSLLQVLGAFVIICVMWFGGRQEFRGVARWGVVGVVGLICGLLYRLNTLHVGLMVCLMITGA